MIVLKTILAVVAAIIVFVEQLRSEGKYRRIMLLLAILIIFGSAIHTWVEYEVDKKSERERIADLGVIQKMTSSLRDLGFELELKDVDSNSVIETFFQVHTAVHTRLAGTGLFADYIIIGHSNDSGWFVANSTFERYKILTFDLDEKRKRLRFILKNFGISASWNQNRAGWEPDNIADLARVRLGLSAGTLHGKDYERYYDTEWCPIEKVNIYANSFDIDNLLVVAERIPKTSTGSRLAYHSFLPRWHESFTNPDAGEFIIEPLRLRDAIISSLD